MSYASILVDVSDDQPGAGRIDHAIWLAGQLDARLVGLMAQEPATPEVSPHDTIGMVRELIREQSTATQHQLDEARRRFIALAGRQGCRGEWVAECGQRVPALIRHGRASDLLVIGRDTVFDGEGGGSDLDKLLLNSGRPLLFVPHSAGQPFLRRNAIVLWHDDRASRRAVRDALPVLRLMKQVVVVQLLDRENSASQPVSGTSDVAAFLQCHGIAARAVALEKMGMPTMERLRIFALDEEADLIVGGGYMHRELLHSDLAADMDAMIELSIPCLFSQ
ncbi:nucleotide-binding universal stress UspA family protein [Bosea sp. BE125]|uniref:hypothetical protein n=1 Tax=Bosea sp. BE125 TaxID=2817909 RepID=UPI00286084A7|nr:hypothetical protein [Bosea sp. BE125]MDR6870380.1 nucleotide-binding universal stress UspA family protein [Bosea sp. BE125]